MTEPKYYKVRDIAQIFSIDPRLVRWYCHADKQNFAYQIVKKGSILIDLKKFEAWLKMHHTEHLRRL